MTGKVPSWQELKQKLHAKALEWRRPQLRTEASSVESGRGLPEGEQASKGHSSAAHPFWVIVHKEIGDHIRSWRVVILLSLMILTCIGSLYAALDEVRSIARSEADASFLFLKLFTEHNGTLPNFITFVSFLGPLLGIGLGFDAVNSERSKGTLGRMISQPIYRDDLLLAKFTAGFALIAILFMSLGLTMVGAGLLALGIPPTPEEFWRIVIFMLIGIVYVGFWLNLSILFSTRLRQAATSAISSIAVWIFFSVFFNMIVQLVGRALAPAGSARIDDILSYARSMQLLMRLSPSQLFDEATMTMLVPSIRSLGLLTPEQQIGAIPSPLPLGQSLLLVWPQVTGLIAATMVCFGIAYALFMRQEIRSK